MKLIGRKCELEILNKFWESESYNLGVVYGRRRIGKSYLLKYFSEGRRAVFFQATTNEKSNLVSLAADAASLSSLSPSVVIPPMKMLLMT